MIDTAQPQALPPVTGKSTPKAPTLVVCLLLALATAAVYWPVSRMGFINFDDPDYVSGNPRVQAGLTAETVRWAFTSGYASNWHPVTWLSHLLDCQLYHLKPAGHHVTNLLFHVVNTLLLFGLLRRLTGAFWRCALVAALFALHPLHVESVAWISERKDVLSAFFFMLTLWAYTCYAEARRPSVEDRIGEHPTSNIQHPTSNAQPPAPTTHHAPRFYLLSLLCFALGLMSKPMLVTVPFVLMLLDYWPLRRFASLESKLPSLKSTPDATRSTQHAPRFTLQPLAVSLLEKLPFFALCAASCVVTFLVQRASGAVTPLDKGPLESRVANALLAYVRYLGKTLWPSKLAVFYPNFQVSFDDWQVVAAGLLLIAITAGVWLLRRRQPWLLVGWFWFAGMLVPVIGLVQVGKQSMADRYTYLPHIGLFVALVWGGAALLGRLPRPRLVAAPVAACALAACMLLTARQLSHWANTLTLFQHAAAVTSQNFVAYTVVGNDFAEHRKFAEAVAECEKALRISPDYPEAHNTLGNVYAQEEKYDDAIAQYRRAEEDASYADPRNGMANVLIKQQKYAEAETQARDALRLAPMHLPAMFSLAIALHSQGKPAEAAEVYRRMIALNPSISTPHRNLGRILVAQGKPDQGIAELALAARLDPKDGETRTLLGMTLMSQNRPNDAFPHLSEAARLQPTNALAQYNLGLIYQSRKQAPEAVQHLRLALKAQPDWPETLNNLAWLLAANPDPAVRNGPEAVSLAERACELTGYQEPLLVGTLAAAYAEAGRFSQAITTAEQARTLALAAGQTAIAQKNEELLALYRAGKPYHEHE